MLGVAGFTPEARVFRDGVFASLQTRAAESADVVYILGDALGEPGPLPDAVNLTGLALVAHLRVRLLVLPLARLAAALLRGQHEIRPVAVAAPARRVALPPGAERPDAIDRTRLRVALLRGVAAQVDPFESNKL